MACLFPGQDKLETGLHWLPVCAGPLHLSDYSRVETSTYLKRRLLSLSDRLSQVLFSHCSHWGLTTRFLSTLPLQSSGWIVVVALFLLPATWLTIWPATVLSPARVGILFMTEAIVGIGSAAWLTNEPFGVREIIGTALIMGAGIVEVLRSQSTPTLKNS